MPNLSILDGWWPEGCEHGVTGWRIGDDRDNSVEVTEEERLAQDKRDRASLYEVLDKEVLPAYAERSKWLTIMRASIAMSQWAFSSDRMVEDYFKYLYRPQ